MPRPPSGSGGRPRREEILDEATRLFAERGYEGASMADLAEAVGMRKASLFYHFASKEVLYGAVFDRQLASFGAAVAAAMQTEGSFEVRLDGLTEGVVRLLGAEPFAARLLIREVMDWGPVIRGQLSDAMIGVMDAATKFIEAGQSAGSFTQGEPRHVLLSVVGVHFLPFALPGLVGKLVGTASTDPEYVTARSAAARAHVRAMLLATGAPAG